MFDFDKFVSSLISQGLSKEQIAEQITDALNKTNKQEKKDGKPKTREEMIEHLSTVFDNHIRNERLDLADASVLVWLCAVKETDFGKSMTDVDELRAFLEFINDDISATIEKWKVFKAVQPIFNLEAGHVCKCKNKGTAETDRESRTDESIIRKFLKEIFD